MISTTPEEELPILKADCPYWFGLPIVPLTLIKQTALRMLLENGNNWNYTSSVFTEVYLFSFIEDNVPKYRRQVEPSVRYSDYIFVWKKHNLGQISKTIVEYNGTDPVLHIIQTRTSCEPISFLFRVF